VGGREGGRVSVCGQLLHPLFCQGKEEGRDKGEEGMSEEAVEGERDWWREGGK